MRCLRRRLCLRSRRGDSMPGNGMSVYTWGAPVTALLFKMPGKYLS